MTHNSAETFDDLVHKLNIIKTQGLENDARMRDEAMLLSRKLVRSLEKPELVAADMIYSVTNPGLVLYLLVKAHVSFSLIAFHTNCRKDCG
jgi:hypothetical protein